MVITLGESVVQVAGPSLQLGMIWWNVQPPKSLLTSSPSFTAAARYTLFQYYIYITTNMLNVHHTSNHYEGRKFAAQGVMKYYSTYGICGAIPVVPLLNTPKRSDSTTRVHHQCSVCARCNCTCTLKLRCCLLCTLADNLIAYLLQVGQHLVYLGHNPRVMHVHFLQ